MKRYVLAFLVACGPAPADKPVQTPTAPVERPANEAIAWRDLAMGEREAATTGKPVLVYFWATWSANCKELDRSFEDPAVRAASRRFVTIRVDASDDEDPATERARRRFSIIGIPTVFAVGALAQYPPESLGETGHDFFRLPDSVGPTELAQTLDRAGR